MRPVVGLIKSDSGTSAKGNLARALELIGFKSPFSVNRISIKPNLCYYWDASTEQTTDPQLVGELIDHLRKTHDTDFEIRVAEAEASAMQTKIVFRQHTLLVVTSGPYHSSISARRASPSLNEVS